MEAVSTKAREDGTALWSGRPAWMSAAIRVWKVRIAAVYFAVLLADGVRIAVAGSHAPPGAWGGEAKLLAIATVAVGGLLLLALLTARTTRYSVEPHGVVMRFGVALPATLVIPYAAIEHVGVRVHRDRTGDIALRLKPGQGVMYPKLWPHARPWKLLRAEPMLRCVREPGVAGAMICREIAAAVAPSPAEPVATPERAAA